MKYMLTLLLSLTMSLSVMANSKNGKKLTELVLTDDNTVSLRTAFTDESVGKLIEDIEKLNSKLPSNYPIFLFLYTPGGSIQAGLELYEYTRSLNRPIHTITMFAASMGFQTVQQLGKRYVLKNGVLMSHNASGQVGGDFSQISSRFGLWLRRLEELDKDTVKRTNGKQTLKSYKESYLAELWMTGEEAVSKGYADEVVSVKCDSSLMNATETVDVQALFLSISIKFSKCPLRTSPTGGSANIETNKGKMTLEAFMAVNPDFKTCSELTYFNSTVEPVCAVDSTLTSVSIRNEVKKTMDFFKTDIKDRVIKY